jgi:hypothetical protein
MRQNLQNAFEPIKVERVVLNALATALVSFVIILVAPASGENCAVGDFSHRLQEKSIHHCSSSCARINLKRSMRVIQSIIELRFATRRGMPRNL